ncbi:MAG: hypothetical protein K0Q90_3390 [Paenibacillaceae bacterium]|jgi:uncharacterized protein YueI|nr:hypothetical protein [Paenibacillaceae bacterium]
MTEEKTQTGFMGYSGKSEMERTLQAGMQGAPRLKPEETSHYLGEFRERVLRVLTKSQVGESIIYREIEEAVHHPKAKLMVLQGGQMEQAVSKYQKLAEAGGLVVTYRRGEEFTGEIGLVVASGDAVDAAEVDVEYRLERLVKKGLTEQLIRAAGQAVCKDCYARIREAAPEELEHYRQINPLSRLFGEKCPGHE